ncbi:MAG: tRNA (adenosine(37)-N6)-dimethylallyltransferase MiaA [Actinomycetota bacterium]
MSDNPTTPILAIVGVTAGGKSALAMEVARSDSRVELVSVDSMQVYRGMDIGTAKPSAAEVAEVRHHMIDVADPWDDYTVSEFQAGARAAIAEIEGRGGVPVLVGGTGLHLRSVIDDLDIPGQFPDVAAALQHEATADLHARLSDLDPEAAARMEPSNRRRVVRALEVTVGSGRPFSSYGPGLDSYPATRFRLIGPRWERPAIDARIERRYEIQMHQGFLAEVRRLASHERGLSRTASQALGYRQLLDHVRGEGSLEDALERAIIATRQFARRQERWFRRDPRITWIDVTENPMEASPAVMGEYETCS